ncbi:MAG: lysylphosphatidylglycerol synthase transmembrane domain-containing protein, partial [Pyrinomonadaceae bacterium]
FITIGVERLYDMVAIVVLFAANLLFLSAPGGDVATYARVRQAGFLLLLGAAAGVAGLVLFRRFSGGVIRRVDGLFARAPKFLKRVGKIVTGLLDQLARALGVLVDARELVVTVGWTALLWGVIVLANLLVFRAFGLNLGVSETVFVLGWSLVGSLVPTPGGGAGPFHLATAAGLVILGATRTPEEAAAVSIILHLVLFGPALFFGLYYFLRSDVSLARLRRLASAETDKPDAESLNYLESAAEEHPTAGADAPRRARA